MAVDTRERIMRAVLRCVERSGVSGFSLEDVASEAELSRTSIYRHFPDGRSQLVSETATWEIGRFWAYLAEAVSKYESLEDRLVEGLVTGAELMGDSRIMANLLEQDVTELAGALEPAEPLVFGIVRDYLAALLTVEAEAGHLQADVVVPEAAVYVTRMMLSTMSSPAGVDLTDRVQTRKIVQREFLGGIVRP